MTICCVPPLQDHSVMGITEVHNVSILQHRSCNMLRQHVRHVRSVIIFSVKYDVIFICFVTSRLRILRLITRKCHNVQLAIHCLWC